MDTVDISYKTDSGEDLSVSIDFANRTARGPGANELLSEIEAWEWYVSTDKNYKSKGYHMMYDMTRSPVPIKHPWASPRDMAVFMRFKSWQDTSQWPQDFAALIPPPKPEKRPTKGDICFVN